MAAELEWGQADVKIGSSGKGRTKTEQVSGGIFQELADSLIQGGAQAPHRSGPHSHDRQRMSQRGGEAKSGT